MLMVRIEDTGPLTKKRMETIDDEVTKAALGFYGKSKARMESHFLFGGILQECISLLI